MNANRFILHVVVFIAAFVGAWLGWRAWPTAKCDTLPKGSIIWSSNACWTVDKDGKMTVIMTNGTPLMFFDGVTNIRIDGCVFIGVTNSLLTIEP